MGISKKVLTAGAVTVVSLGLVFNSMGYDNMNAVSAENNISKWKEMVTGYSNKVNQLKESISGYLEIINSKDSTLAEKQAKIEELQGQISTLEKQLEQSGGTNKELESQIATLEAQVKTLQDEVATLETDITGLRTYITELQAIINAQQDDIDALADASQVSDEIEAKYLEDMAYIPGEEQKDEQGGETEGDNPPQVTIHTCEECGSEFNNEAELNDHMSTHETQESTQYQEDYNKLSDVAKQIVNYYVNGGTSKVLYSNGRYECNGILNINFERREEAINFMNEYGIEHPNN